MTTQLYNDFDALEGDLETVAESAEEQLYTPLSKARLVVAGISTGAIALFYGDQPGDALLKSVYMTLGTLLGVGFGYSFKRSEIAGPIAGLAYYFMTTRSNALDYGSNQPVIVEAIGGALMGEAGSQIMAAKAAKASSTDPKPNKSKPAAAGKSSCNDISDPHLRMACNCPKGATC